MFKQDLTQYFTDQYSSYQKQKGSNAILKGFYNLPFKEFPKQQLKNCQENFNIYSEQNIEQEKHNKISFLNESKLNKRIIQKPINMYSKDIKKENIFDQENLRLEINFKFYTEEDLNNEIQQLGFLRQMDISKTSLVSDITTFISQHYLHSNINIKQIINEGLQKVLEDQDIIQENQCLKITVHCYIKDYIKKLYLQRDFLPDCPSYLQTSPSLISIYRMNKEQIQNIKNFSVSTDEFTIIFLKDVNLLQVNIGDLINLKNKQIKISDQIQQQLFRVQIPDQFTYFMNIEINITNDLQEKQIKLLVSQIEESFIWPLQEFSFDKNKRILSLIFQIKFITNIFIMQQELQILKRILLKGSTKDKYIHKSAEFLIKSSISGLPTLMSIFSDQIEESLIKTPSLQHILLIILIFDWFYQKEQQAVQSEQIKQKISQLITQHLHNFKDLNKDFYDLSLIRDILNIIKFWRERYFLQEEVLKQLIEIFSQQRRQAFETLSKKVDINFEIQSLVNYANNQNNLAMLDQQQNEFAQQQIEQIDQAQIMESFQKQMNELQSKGVQLKREIQSSLEIDIRKTLFLIKEIQNFKQTISN